MSLDTLFVLVAVIAAWPWWAPAATVLCALLVWVAVRDGSRKPEQIRVPQCPDGCVRRCPDTRTVRTGRCPDTRRAVALSCTDTVRTRRGRGC